MKHRRETELFCFGHMAGGVDEGSENLVGHGRRIDAERRKLDVMDGNLTIRPIAVSRLITHPERAGGDRALLDVVPTTTAVVRRRPDLGRRHARSTRGTTPGGVGPD